jgi:hypothetical protein
VTGIGLRALGAELKQAKADHKRDRTTLTAAGRLILTYRPEDSARQTSEVEARILRDAPPEEMFVYAGRPSRLVEAELDHSYHMDRGERSAPPPVLLIEAYTDVAMRALAEGHTVFQGEGASGPYNIAIPPTTVSMLRELPSASVPRVRGILVHPIALPDGTLLATNGLHKPTGLFVHGVSAMDVRPYTRAEAVQAWARLNHSFLSGFEFAGTLQAHIALAGLFTAVQRRLMDCAPGLMILAPIQSAGKTTLARRIHGVLTGRDMPVVTLTVGNDEEIEKRLLAMLLRSPAMVTFDNIPDGLTVNCGAALNSALTSPVFDGRLLGSTQMLQVPTNVFFVVTGNNLRLGKDEVSRWLTTVLAPAHARPQDRSFRHPDVMGHALSIRDQVLRDVVGIASGYLASGDRVSLDTGTRFPQWETMVRKPIVWAGGEDVARSFTINGEDSEHDQALRMLLTSLREAHGDRTFYARDVVDLASGFLQADGGETYRRVQDALEMLGARDVTKALSVGRVLAGYADRPVSIHDETLRLRARDDRNRVRCYLVETCGGCGI